MEILRKLPFPIISLKNHCIFVKIREIVTYFQCSWFKNVLLVRKNAFFEYWKSLNFYKLHFFIKFTSKVKIIKILQVLYTFFDASFFRHTGVRIATMRFQAFPKSIFSWKSHCFFNEFEVFIVKQNHRVFQK